MLGSAYKADPQAKPEQTQKVYIWDVDIKYQCHMYDTLIQRFQAGIECTEAKVQYQSPEDNYTDVYVEVTLNGNSRICIVWRW